MNVISFFWRALYRLLAGPFVLRLFSGRLIFVPYSFSGFKLKIKNVEEWLHKEFQGIRTGRATPVLLDSVHVEAYGAQMPLNQVGSIAIEDSRTLRVSPWDKSKIKDIEKAIQTSNLGLSVSVDDIGLRVSFPPLTEERRQGFVKIAKSTLEEARIFLRREREEVWNDIQKQEKDGKLSEDEKFRAKDEMQKLVDETNRNLENFFSRKEQEIMS